MKQITFLNTTLTYDDPYGLDSGLLKTVEETLPTPLETYMPKTTEQLKSEHPYLSKTSTRNDKNVYIIEVEKDQTLLNIIPQKRFIDDSNIKYIFNNTFEFFEEVTRANELPDPFVLADGSIFRVTGEGVLDREQYTYYTIKGGKVEQIPNYKTVEVLLAERGKIVDEIRVIELGEFEDLMRVTYENIYIEQGMTPEDAALKAAETMVKLAEESNLEQ